MKKDVMVSIICIATSIFLYYTLGWIDDERARSFPRVVIIIMGILSFMLLLQTMAVKKTKEKGKPLPWKRFLIMFVLVLVYLYFMETIGFYTSAFLFIVVVTLLFGQSGFSPVRILSRTVISAVFTGVIFVLFNVLLKVQTPTGLFF